MSNSNPVVIASDQSNLPVVSGGPAHDVAISGSPFRAGGRARTADFTAVVQDDVTDFVTDTVGKQIVRL